MHFVFSVPTLQQATADPCLHQRLLDNHRQVSASLLCGHCSFLLGLGAHKVLFKKVGKTTRPFRYDLNQIPYDYTVEVRNRFKGLDLIECLRMKEESEKTGL